VLDRWQRDCPFEAIGIASFGPVDIDPASPGYGSLGATPKPGWAQVPLVERWRRFGVPIGFDVDVVGAARAEQRWGAGQGLADLAYITVGTGIGVGPIIGGKSVAGRGHSEMGHTRVARLPGDDWPGSCPFHGDCVEGLASGSAIAARHGPGSIADDWAGWEAVEHALAMLVHNIFLSIQPRRILMGGGVAEGRPSLTASVLRRAVQSLAGYHSADTLGDDYLVAPGLGPRAGPLGAIALGLTALGR